ncbi:hypothetical protein F4777DRAFT_575283 [Nemania sp. FL0916]|nr:hypothetical protein F4777DRAFT_575283 [Nemania sp. FL0916]
MNLLEWYSRSSIVLQSSTSGRHYGRRGSGVTQSLLSPKIETSDYGSSNGGNQEKEEETHPSSPLFSSQLFSSPLPSSPVPSPPMHGMKGRRGTINGENLYATDVNPYAKKESPKLASNYDAGLHLNTYNPHDQESRYRQPK